MDKSSSNDVIKEFIVSNRDSYYRLAYSYVHNREDALDIIQDAIYKALSASKSLDEPKAVESWFIRIIVNTALDYIRKNKRYVYVEDDVLDAASPPVEDEYEDLDLKEAIEKLSTLNKTVIILRFFKDMKIEDIARIMNENVNTTKTRLYSSIRKLRLDLKEINL